MVTEAPTPPLQLSEGYRHARRLTSVLCALALAWGAAQFEFKTPTLGPVGEVDLSGASLPIIMACAIAYAMTRCVLEFAMQPIEVRRWNLAQIDFKITVFLVRAAALILGAGGIYRSVDTIVMVVVFLVVLVVASGLFIFLGMLALTPLMVELRKRRGSRPSIATSVFEAMNWAMLISVGLLIVLYVVLGAGFLYYEPLRTLWTVPPSTSAVVIFVITGIAVVLSVYLEQGWSQEIFAAEPPYTEERLPDGSIQRTYKKTSRSETPMVVRISKRSQPD